MLGFGKKEKTNDQEIKPSRVKMAMAATAIAATALAAGVKEAPASEQPERPTVINEAPVTLDAKVDTTVPQSTTTEAPKVQVEISKEAVTISRDQVGEYPSVPLSPVAQVDGETGLATYVDGADGIQRIVPENPLDGPGEIAPPSPADMQIPTEPQL